MDVTKLAREIIEGRRLGREDDLSDFVTCDLEELCRGADKIREAFLHDEADLCSIINARSGKCPEDCKYCAQSAHYKGVCKTYDFLPEATILEACLKNQEAGADRFSLVTAGRALTGEEFEKAVHVYETLHSKTHMGLCASMGFLSPEQLRRLREAGVSNYHCNIETSRRYFPFICTTHSFEQKIEMLKRVKAAGLRLCSGVLLGMGETWEDRLDMALCLAELGADSIPINALMPIPGTPLEHQSRLKEEELLRTIAFFRYIDPTAHIRLAAGRLLYTNNGEKAFCSGASAAITGNMLTTTSKATALTDTELLTKLGRKLPRPAVRP